MLTKAQLIDSVVELNPSVTREWLGQFSADEIRTYLTRLHFAEEPRGAASTWVRRPFMRAEPAVDIRAA